MKARVIESISLLPRFILVIRIRRGASDLLQHDDNDEFLQRIYTSHEFTLCTCKLKKDKKKIVK